MNHNLFCIYCLWFIKFPCYNCSRETCINKPIILYLIYSCRKWAKYSKWLNLSLKLKLYFCGRGSCIVTRNLPLHYFTYKNETINAIINLKKTIKDLKIFKELLTNLDRKEWIWFILCSFVHCFKLLRITWNF